MPAIDLALLKPGVRVKLRGTKSGDPRKPWPRGWKTVEETDANLSMWGLIGAIRVESDERWLPVDLIEEIVP
jgi:hypothetical protein